MSQLIWYKKLYSDRNSILKYAFLVGLNLFVAGSVFDYFSSEQLQPIGVGLDILSLIIFLFIFWYIVFILLYSVRNSNLKYAFLVGLIFIVCGTILGRVSNEQLQVIGNGFDILSTIIFTVIFWYIVLSLIIRFLWQKLHLDSICWKF